MHIVSVCVHVYFIVSCLGHFQPFHIRSVTETRSRDFASSFLNYKLMTGHAMPSIHVRENRRVNQEWTIQRHWQHCVHKIQDEDTQSKTYNNT